MKSINEKDLICIVSNYNNGKYLKKCLKSIYDQKTEFSYNVVIIDDCSNDNSKENFEKFKQKYNLKNFYFFSTKKNQGSAKSAYLNLKKIIDKYIQTKYIFRIDSDDYLINKDKFEIQIGLLEKNKNLIAAAHKYKILKKNKLINNTEEVYTGTIETKFMIYNLFYQKYNLYNHTSTYIFRNIFKSLYPPQYENLKIIKGDVIYSWFYLRYGPVYVIDKYMSVYRIHEKGVWSSLSNQKKYFQEKFLNLIIFFCLNNKNKRYFCQVFFISFIDYWNNCFIINFDKTYTSLAKMLKPLKKIIKY